MNSDPGSRPYPNLTHRTSLSSSPIVESLVCSYDNFTTARHPLLHIRRNLLHGLLVTGPALPGLQQIFVVIAGYAPPWTK
jgi:hypothetical protein